MGSLDFISVETPSTVQQHQIRFTSCFHCELYSRQPWAVEAEVGFDARLSRAGVGRSIGIGTSAVATIPRTHRSPPAQRNPSWSVLKELQHAAAVRLETVVRAWIAHKRCAAWGEMKRQRMRDTDICSRRIQVSEL